jgi:hypothetical protein
MLYQTGGEATMPEPNLTGRQQKWFATVRAGLERHTGKTMAEWVAIAGGGGDCKCSQICPPMIASNVSAHGSPAFRGFAASAGDDGG